MANSTATRVVLYNNGPVQVLGPIEIETESGQRVLCEGEENWLCRCGGSKNKPFCDGSHRSIKFNAQESDIKALAPTASASVVDGYVAVAKAADVPEGEVVGVTVGGRPAVLCNVDGAFYCVGGICTHQFAPMAGGDLDGHTLWCPLHNSGFDVRTGLANQPPATDPIATYKVRVDGGQVYVEAGS